MPALQPPRLSPVEKHFALNLWCCCVIVRSRPILSGGGTQLSADFPHRISRFVGFVAGSTNPGNANSGFRPAPGWVNGLSLGQQAHRVAALGVCEEPTALAPYGSSAFSTAASRALSPCWRSTA